MKFTEEKLEQTVIKLLLKEVYKHFTGDHIHKETPNVFLRDDLMQYPLFRNENEYDRIFRYIKKNLCNPKPDTLNGCVGNCLIETIASEGE